MNHVTDNFFTMWPSPNVDTIVSSTEWLTTDRITGVPGMRSRSYLSSPTMLKPLLDPTQSPIQWLTGKPTLNIDNTRACFQHKSIGTNDEIAYTH